ncbi:MAG: cytosolic protein, partial [Pimelobacter sp.]|nr:cytosolic protein [Pimelobacter sp.]
SVPYVDFVGAEQTGQLVVATEVADTMLDIFADIHAARYPIQSMRPVHEFAGDDGFSMAANNTSAYNCRTVAGTDTFSDHAYGRAIDLNPVQNPYLRGATVQPPRGSRFVDVDRSPSASTGRGVIGSDDVVTRTFARAGWSWGGDFSDPDFQHFSAG